MQLLKSITSSKRRGYALLIILTFLGVSLIAFASMMRWVGSNAKITQRNNLFNQSQSAAESATETVIANMAQDFFRQGLNSSNSYMGVSCLPPTQSGWPTTFQFSDLNGTPDASSVNIGAFTTNWYGTLPPRFKGLTPYGRFCDIYSRATPTNVSENPTAMIHQQVWFGTIPAFQFAIFYNPDLEIEPGKTMNINGPVHSNGNIYAGGWALTFSDLVGAVLECYKNARSPLDYRTELPGMPTFSITTNNPLSGAQVISLPIGATNDQATALSFLAIPPAGATNADAYPYNRADIVVTHEQWGPGISVKYQNQTQLPYDVTNNGTPGYSFVTNVIFYDYHEGGWVNAVQLDVGQFGKWQNNNSAAINQQMGRTTINSVYVSTPYPIPAEYMPGGVASKLPGVRLVNGSQLPTAGLTVATAQPIYVLGDYNTTTNGTTYSKALGDTVNTRPAALMGDAVTILSSNWSDVYQNSNANSRPATATTVNAAILEGNTPTGYYNGRSYSSGGSRFDGGRSYSGGVENIFRLLESWDSIPLTYNGSIVVLFSSQYAITPNYSDNQGIRYYNQPLRYWGFDLNFLDMSKLPPMTPMFPAFVRTSWSSTQ